MRMFHGFTSLLGIGLMTAASGLYAQTATFEGLRNTEEVLNYYNGGAGSSGSTGGANLGEAYSTNALALISSTHGGSGNFSNNPSGDTILFFQSGTAATMNVAGGFTTGFSFYYAASSAASVQVFDGLNGTGTLLATLPLAATPTPYSTWDSVGVSFAGTAKSVNFGGAANNVGFDDITINSAVADAATPEPGAIALFGSLALAGVGLLKRRRRATS